ncbi:MAG: hypothetical protein IPJ61_14990 [Tessaracoccus sp.]|uniref:hypothetical protein n=1 Tax=Tessaracoccus sp. TaxID=1971211 RepID=UPI001EBCBD89|nr:hypothetical protein [Tessaracoccus sp.]MBK7822321.1 hypothetical protein [Tessaracoccus sp.]
MGQYPDFTGGQENQAAWEHTRRLDDEPTTSFAPPPEAAPSAPTYADPYGNGRPAPTPYGASAPYPQDLAPAPSIPYGYGGYQGNPYALGEHPQAQIVFILGIVGIFTGIPAFIAWYMGGQARKEIQGGAPYRWEGNLKTGYLLGKVFGIISIVGVALGIVFWIAYFGFIMWMLTSF